MNFKLLQNKNVCMTNTNKIHLLALVSNGLILFSSVPSRTENCFLKLGFFSTAKRTFILWCVLNLI